MDNNWFFRWIWRFNALALALVLIAAAIGLAIPFLAFQVPVHQVAIGPKTAVKAPNYVWRLEFPAEGRQEAVLALVVLKDDADASGFGSKGYDPAKIVNYLYVDSQTGATRWLFPTNKQIITAADGVFTKPNTTPGFLQDPPVAIIYDVVAGDPVSESLRQRKYDVYMSNPGGENLTKLLDGLDEVPSSSAAIRSRYLVRQTASPRCGPSPSRTSSR
jgi:hypothetical protein